MGRFGSTTSISRRSTECFQRSPGSSFITFQCTAGRHRSVAAAMLLERLFWIARPQCEVSVAHAHEHRWKDSTCSGNCDACWYVRHRAPDATLQALVNGLYDEAQQRAAYMRVLCHWGCARNQVTCPFKLPTWFDGITSEICSSFSVRLHLIERHQDFSVSSVQAGMEHQFVDWDLFHDISPISIHNEDDLSSFHIEPQSNISSSRVWIGAQHYSPPQFHTDQDHSLEKTLLIL